VDELVPSEVIYAILDGGNPERLGVNIAAYLSMK
jgi:hypothetical protein